MQARAPHSTQTNGRRALCAGTTKAIANFWRLRTTTTAASVLEHNIDHMHRVLEKSSSNAVAVRDRHQRQVRCLDLGQELKYVTASAYMYM